VRLTGDQALSDESVPGNNDNIQERIPGTCIPVMQVFVCFKSLKSVEECRKT